MFLFRSLKPPKGVRYLSPKKPEAYIELDSTKPRDHCHSHPTTPVAISTTEIPLTINTIDTTQRSNSAELPVRDSCTSLESFPKRNKITLSPNKAATSTGVIDNGKSSIKEETSNNTQIAAPEPGQDETGQLPLLKSDPFHSTDALLSWIKMVGEQLFYDQKLYSKDNADCT